MNKHYIDLKIETKDSLRTLKELYRFNIDVTNIRYYKENIIVKILYSDYKKISKFYKTKIIKHYNLYGIKDDLIKSKYFVFSLLLFLFLVYFISHIIIDIKIVSSNAEMQKLITYELNKHKVKKYTIEKDFDELTSIKEDIISNNKDKIEWLEIERIGMTYTVKVEERIINNIEKEDVYCNLVANKDGLIKRFNISKGDAIININDYVKKGDVLVSGSINFNEENKDNVCASGVVYANTWYNMNLKINKTYKESIKTSKKRNNITIKNNGKYYRIFKNRLDTFESTDKKIFKLFDTKFYWTTDYEIETITKEYTDDEIEELIEKEIKDKFAKLLVENYTIISKKVLKKDVKDSIIDIDIFIIIEENIAERKEYQLME